MNKYKKILDNGLCLGCGLCSAVENSCKMELKMDGFYHPVNLNSENSQLIIEKICPAINVKNDYKGRDVWGNIKFVANAWASDSEIRHKSSSGGVTSALCIFLLESKKVDAVLQVKANDGDYLHNSLHVSRNRDDILKCNASRYAPAAVFDNITDILKKSNETYAFVGKPCDIAGIKNYINEFPQFKNRIKYFLAIFCAGMPSYNASIEAISKFNNKSQPVDLRYRGDGWPGYFTVKYEDGSTDKMTYNDSWGKILGKRLGFRCKICPDGIGLLADIASGDSWNTKNGYPDFTEAEGENFCFVRTDAGETLFNDAVDAGFVEKEPVDINDIKHMQAYQHDRRRYVGWRIVAVQLISNGLLNFKGLGLKLLPTKARPTRIVKEFFGTIRRLIKVKRKISADYK